MLESGGWWRVHKRRRVRPSVAPGLAHASWPNRAKRSGPQPLSLRIHAPQLGGRRLSCLHSSELYGQGAMAGDLFQRSSQSPAYWSYCFNLLFGPLKNMLGASVILTIAACNND
jgi:hypothetical protein